MKALHLMVGLALLSPFALAQGPAKDLPTDPHARDLVQLTDWFEGEFDNEEQLWFENDPRSATAEEDKHRRLHVMHRRLALPAFGEHVFYVEEYLDNDAESITRQRFVIFSSQGAGGSIRMQQGFFRDPQRARGAQHDPEKLAKLTADDVFFMNECDVFWKREADQYVGEISPRSCVFGEGDEERHAVHRMVLSEDKYWRVDTTRLTSNDALHVGHSEDDPYRLRRAAPFICEMRVLLESGETQFARDLSLHSQGGSATVTRKDNGEDYLLRLRDKQYPYYNRRPDFLFLSVRKAGERLSLAYALADPGSRRISVSTQGIAAHCHRQGFTFREPIELLP